MKKNAICVMLLNTKILTLCVTFLYEKNNALCVKFLYQNIYRVVLVTHCKRTYNQSDQIEKYIGALD